MTSTMAIDTTIVREAHASALEGVDCDLIWDRSFLDSSYSYVVNGFDAQGNPVELFLVSRSATKIVIRTMINANLFALARPYTI
jgi:hypothetical protein